MKPGWTEVALGDVATIERRAIDPDRIEAGVHYIGLEDISSAGAVLATHLIGPGDLKSQKFRFDRGHVLFGKLRPNLAKITTPDVDGVCSTDILPIRPGDAIEQRFLLHHLRRPASVAEAARLASGANLPRISPATLLTTRLPLPPIEEQRRIAAVLDRTDTLSQQHRSAFSLVDLLGEAAFLAAFGDPVANPRGWPASAVLSDVSSIASGITKGRKVKGSATRAVPYLAVANVQAGRLALGTVKTIAATEQEIERYRLADGDLVLTEGGDPDKLGRGTVWRSEIAEAIHQNHIFRVRITDPDRFDPEFLVRLVGSERGRRYFLRSAKQTTGIASINKSQLSAFPLLEPPIALQRRFVEELGTINRLRIRAERRADRLTQLFASLQDRAFRGDL